MHRSDRKLQFYMRLLNYRAGEQQGTSGRGRRRRGAEIKTKNQKNKTIVFLPPEMFLHCVCLHGVCASEALWDSAWWVILNGNDIVVSLQNMMPMNY